jgi:hypothetical protein
VAIPCPWCGAEVDITLSSFGVAVDCPCGRRAEELRRRADALTWTLLYGDLSAIDVDLAIERLRDHVRTHLPDRLDLFEMVWVARWRRLREQGWSRERPAW